MKVIEHRKYFFLFSGICIIASIVAIAMFGFKAGIDLKGGTQWNVVFEKEISKDALVSEIKTVIKDGEVLLNEAGNNEYIIRMPDMSEESHQALLQGVQSHVGNVQEKSFSSIGPAIGNELRKKAIWGIVLVLLGISLYIAYAFRKVSEPVKSWKYGIATLFSLAHDVIIPAGLIAVLGKTHGIEMDTNFIVALLLIMGFSVHDTIVVFDRIRENVMLARGKKIDFKETVNFSIRETFARSVNTSLTLVLVLVALLIFGPSSLFYFVLVILVGTIFGTYSSIFIASPLLYTWQKK